MMDDVGAAAEDGTSKDSHPSDQPDLKTPSQHCSADPRISDPRLSIDEEEVTILQH